MNDPQATEEKYKRKPVFQWTWQTWVGTILVLAILGGAFLAATIALMGGPPFKEIIGYALALTAFPLALWLFWEWYKALHEEEEETRTIPLPGAESREPESREPILYKPYAPKRLEPPSAFVPEVMIVLLKELWEHGRLSRREVMGLRLPSGQTISRAMWERLIGGYTDSIGNERPGLLAEAGLVIRTTTGSWAWRDGLTLEGVMNCFDWGNPQIEAPKPSQDVGGAGWAGRTQEERETSTLAEQRRARWLEVGCDVEQYLKGR